MRTALPSLILVINRLESKENQGFQGAQTVAAGADRGRRAHSAVLTARGYSDTARNL